MGYINLKSKNNENIKNDKSQKIPIKIGHNSNYYSQNNISEISKELILTPFYLVEQWVDYFYFLVFSDLSNLRVNYLHSCRREGPPQSVTITTRIILTPTSQITGLKINFFRIRKIINLHRSLKIHGFTSFSFTIFGFIAK